jgi:hypothetical protein
MCDTLFDKNRAVPTTCPIADPVADGSAFAFTPRHGLRSGNSGSNRAHIPISQIMTITHTDDLRIHVKRSTGHALTGLRPSPPRRVVVAPVGRCGDTLCPGMNRPWAVGGLAACVRPEPIMTLPRTAADVLSEHVVFEVESIDRMYLNVYVPELQRVGQVVGFLTRHRGFEIASTALVAPMSKDFVEGIGRYALAHEVPLIDFVKGQRKDDVMHEHLARFDQPEGVLFIGRAQEKARIFRTEKRRNPPRERPTRGSCPRLPWLITSTSTQSMTTVVRSF